MNYEDVHGIKYEAPGAPKQHEAQKPGVGRKRGKWIGAARTHNVVHRLPVVIRTFDTFDNENSLARYALLCMLGEKINMNTLQVYWLNRVFHECPEDVSFREWLYFTAFEEKGIGQMFNKDVINIQNQPVDRQAILKELHTISRCMSDHRGEIGTLMGISSIGYITEEGSGGDDDDDAEFHEEYLDLRTTTFYHLTQLNLMEPYTAAKFMLMTRPCEHVLLTPTMLEWGNTMPAVMGIDRNKKRDAAPEQLPKTTPTDAHEYAKYEYYVRRQQRCYYPGLTSLEAHMLIHDNAGVYDG